MTTDPRSPAPSDYQDDRPRPPDRTVDAGCTIPTYATHAVPPMPPLPPHPPAPVHPESAGASPSASLDPVHPAPEAPCPEAEPFPARETSTGTGTDVDASEPKTTGPDPAQRPTPVRTPAEKPRAPQDGPRDEEAPSRHPAGSRPWAPGPADRPASAGDADDDPGAESASARDAYDDPGAESEADEATPVRDAIEDPRPLGTVTPEPGVSSSPWSGTKALHDSTDADPVPVAGAAQDTAANESEQPIHTLLWTAATERPVEEVAALVSRLKRTGEVDSPGDLALRAAAVSRPLEEVRQLVALLNEYPHPLHEADTTLRAAAVGRPIEDVVQLVNMIGTSAGERRSASDDAVAEEPRPAADAARDEVPAASGPAAATEPSQKSPWPMAALNGALAAGPDSHTISPALRSGLRWPAALVLFACGVIHLPTDVAGLRSGGYSETLSVAVTVLCLVVAVWLAVRDTAPVWAAAAGLAVGAITLHALAGVGTVNLLQSSLGDFFGSARAAAVLCAGGTAVLAGSALLRRRQPAAGATRNT
ncbi:hypothetical protein [Streptomyces peucetius]|uniref:Uncharacterized protein n=1 Tax=Streptomyces peucetius TaxID=1950 RepID=A0ABY6I0W0_STRPE|nr:hypothetical protein [Streptomyces peucetius]UYQ60503.1 hypothetical protein OGH68_02770 [Streptomyces peucetius]